MAHLRSRSDGELLKAAREDPDAFAAFYERHFPSVLGFFRARVLGEDAAFDLTAETFAAALQALPRFRLGPEPPTAWLFAIARHKLSESVRRGRVDDRARRALHMQPITLDDEGLAILDALEPGPVLELLAELPEDQRAAIDARHLRELDYPAIAAELRCSESVVRKRVSRGLASIRTRLTSNREEAQ